MHWCSVIRPASRSSSSSSNSCGACVCTISTRLSDSVIVPSKSTTIRAHAASALPAHFAIVWSVVADRHQLVQRLGALQGLDGVHPAHRDALALAEREQRLAVGREHPPHRLLAMAVEIRVHADLAGHGPCDGLVVLLAVVVFIAHGTSRQSTLRKHEHPHLRRPEHDRAAARRPGEAPRCGLRRRLRRSRPRLPSPGRPGRGPARARCADGDPGRARRDRARAGRRTTIPTSPTPSTRRWLPIAACCRCWQASPTGSARSW